MAAIYIHIPFCSKACHYCNFHFSTSLHRKAEMVEALHRELLHLQVPGGVSLQRQVETIYFGGGTPSLLSPSELESTLQLVHDQFSVIPGAEITMETNPDDINSAKLALWRSLGINRLSIGVQSFREEDLRWMNRAHDAQQAIKSIEAARKQGFDNLTIDLIYGLPQLSNADWENNIQTAANLGVPHLSCYALTVEEKTALQHFIKKGKVKPIDETKQAEQFMILMESADRVGWEHYEISNFAKTGMRSRHNSSYWQGKPYYGFGPSAHSFDGALTRWWNVPSNSFYISQIMAGQPAHESEILSPVQRTNELIMTQLRTMEGLEINPSEQAIEGRIITPAQWRHFEKIAEQQLQLKQVAIENNRVQLTQTGKLYADYIAAALFLEE